MNDKAFARVLKRFEVVTTPNFDSIFNINENGEMTITPIPCIVEYIGNSAKKKDSLVMLRNEIVRSIKRLSYKMKSTTSRIELFELVPQQAQLLGMKRSINAQLGIKED